MLDKKYFQKNAEIVAPSLLGKLLCRNINNQIIKSRIVETEAYQGKDDTACHASKGKTKRTSVMYKAGGVIYIYLIYGMYHMLNIVTGKQNQPQAVLIRAVEPVNNFNEKQSALKKQSNGPGKLCRFLEITGSLNDQTLSKQSLWIEDDLTYDNFDIIATTRIGIGYADKIDQDKLWRFYLKNSQFVSKR